VLEVVLQQRVERGGQQVLVQDFIGSSIGAQASDCVLHAVCCCSPIIACQAECA
jgi:hypothetical protein